MANDFVGIGHFVIIRIAGPWQGCKALLVEVCHAVGSCSQLVSVSRTIAICVGFQRIGACVEFPQVCERVAVGIFLPIGDLVVIRIGDSWIKSEQMLKVVWEQILIAVIHRAGGRHKWCELSRGHGTGRDRESQIVVRHVGEVAGSSAAIIEAVVKQQSAGTSRLQ